MSKIYIFIKWLNISLNFVTSMKISIIDFYLTYSEYLCRLLFDEVERVCSATSAYDIFDLPVLIHNLWAHWTIRCMHWMQKTQMRTRPMEPTHKPAKDIARGKANIPVPMFPFITWMIVCSMLETHFYSHLTKN